MLVIDDNKLKLIKMHEALLKVGAPNKEETLQKYMDIVIEIDNQAYADILADIEQINEHNQSLEDELQFLERIKGSYEQLLELQLSFKKVYELYGDGELDLSDLSQLNIEYIEDRISVINGYLVNLKNIESNSSRLQELSNNLVEEEKKRSLLSKRLLGLEAELRENFLSAEGRDSNLQYTSIISEYESLGLNFKKLLAGGDELEQLLSSLSKERIDVEEKLKTAEICYNSSPSAESKQILDDIRKDFLNVRYRVAMVKIIELLAQSHDNYDDFKEKRENILSLIKYRISCLEELGVSFSVDPFGRTKVSEQLQTLLSLTDNSKNVNRIRKEIAQLDERTEEMKTQNIQYLKSLGETKALIENRTSMNDIDISGVYVEAENTQSVRTVISNQVVGVRSVPTNFNMRIAKQKTAQVIQRVSSMFREVKVLEPNNDEVVSPQLVIVPKELQMDVHSHQDAELALSGVDDSLEETNVALEVKGNEISLGESDIFTTIEPFVDAPMFVDRADESFEVVTSSAGELSTDTLATLSSVGTQEVVSEIDEETMPDAFWVTQEQDDVSIDMDGTEEVSFDDQVNALLSGDSVVTRSRKKTA